MKQQHEISATVQAILGTQVRKKFWHHQGRFSSVSVVATGRMMALAGERLGAQHNKHGNCPFVHIKVFALTNMGREDSERIEAGPKGKQSPAALRRTHRRKSSSASQANLPTVCCNETFVVASWSSCRGASKNGPFLYCLFSLSTE